MPDMVDVRLVDAKLKRATAKDIADDIEWADIVGISALNFEAHAASDIADTAKRLDSQKIVALGGPYAHKRAAEILQRSPNVDWVFDGESERTFPAAIRHYHELLQFDGTIAGMYLRCGDKVVTPANNDFISDLDALPFAAWDLVDFDAYAKMPNFNFWMEGTRYAPLFTSRGCPYLCGYCHDIFTKKFRWQSAERVLSEIDYLVKAYQVDEFQIIDDIFNLHKPRVKKIFTEVKARYGDRLHFCFPNGLRGDILDKETIRVMRAGGTYQITVAVETVTPRLQTLLEKNLDVSKVNSFIDYCFTENIVVKGFFMLGFPTESRKEIWDTIRFAWRSKLSFASFFTVVPQPGTPLYDLAERENSAALRELREGLYYTRVSWYQRAYGYPIMWVATIAYLIFFFKPWRAMAILKRSSHGSFRSLRIGIVALISIITSIDFYAAMPRLKAWLRGQSIDKLRTSNRLAD